jgi:hypothetical protein
MENKKATNKSLIRNMNISQWQVSKPIALHAYKTNTKPWRKTYRRNNNTKKELLEWNNSLLRTEP